MRMKTFTFLIILTIVSIFVSGCTLEEEQDIIIDMTPEETVPAPPPLPVESATLTPEETEPPVNESTASWKADGIIEDQEYENMVTGFRDLFYIYWTSDEELLYVGIKGKTSGWIGVGFNPTVIMKDADIILGGNRGSGGKLYIYDMYSTNTIGPTRADSALGGSFNLIDYAGAEKSAYQTLEFSRKLDTADKFDSVLKKGESAKVLWALSYSDSIDLKHDAGKGTVEIIV